jgi:hypothetical protein
MDGWIVTGLGVLFMVLGVVVFLWGRRELTDYYDAITRRQDMREFLEHSPLRPEPEALKIGGIITVVVGLALVVMGVIWL